jgi:outer membrane immunogenic protein
MQGYSRIASVTCSIAFGVCALAGVASAADLPSRSSTPIAPVVVAPPIFTWSGFYAGVNLGYDFAGGKKADPFFGKDGYSEAARGGLKDAGFSFSEKSKGGVMGGAQVGYNYQLGQVVLGVEADVQMLTLSREATVTHKDLGYNGSLKQTLGGFGTVRGRIGYAFDRFLVFGTAGYGVAKSSQRFTESVDVAGFNETGNAKRTGYLGGLVVGGGVEYAVTDNVSVKGEYLYAKLNPLTKSSIPSERDGYSNKDVSFSIVRAGLNYKF